MNRTISILKDVWAWYPPVGVFIAILALVSVAVPFFRDLAKIGRGEKALIFTRSIELGLNSSDRMQTRLCTSGGASVKLPLRFVRRNLISALRAVRTMP